MQNVLLFSRIRVYHTLIIHNILHLQQSVHPHQMTLYTIRENPKYGIAG